jgi:hypothetical protein
MYRAKNAYLVTVPGHGRRQQSQQSSFTLSFERRSATKIQLRAPCTGWGRAPYTGPAIHTPMAACSVGAVVAEPPQVPRYLVRSGTRRDTELGGRACAWSAAWRSTGPPARSGRTSPTMATTRAGGPASASCAHRGPDRPRPASPPTRRCGSSERPSAPTQPSIGSTQGACSSGERTSGRRTCRGRAWWSRPAGRRPLHRGRRHPPGWSVAAARAAGGLAAPAGEPRLTCGASSGSWRRRRAVGHHRRPPRHEAGSNLPPLVQTGRPLRVMVVIDAQAAAGPHSMNS